MLFNRTNPGSQSPGISCGCGIFSNGSAPHHEAVQDPRTPMEKPGNLSLLAKLTDNAVVFTDANRKITWTNEAFTRITGYSKDEILGLNPNFLQGPKTDPLTLKRMRSALDAQRGFKECVLNYTKTGTPYWNQIEVIPRFGSDGKLIGFMAIQADVTERVETEDELLRLRAAVEQSANMIVITDNTGLIEYVNPQFEKTTGYSAAEVIGKNPRILKSGKQDEEFYQDLWQCLLEGKSWTGKFQNLTKDGKIFWESATISPVFDREGKIAHFIAIKQDITERVADQSEILRAKEMLEKTGRLARVGGWEYDVETRLLQWTPELCAILQTPAITKGSLDSIISLMEPGTRTEFRSAFNQAIATGAGWDIEGQLIDGHGTLKWVRIVGDTITTDDAVTRLYGAIQDVSRRKSLESDLIAARDRAESANVAKSRFLANMSHEIRTPLNAILGMTELLQEDPKGDRAAELVDAIRLSGETLLALISDVLDLSKIEADEMELENVVFNLRECTENSIAIVSLFAEKKGLKIALQVDPALPECILGDVVRLRQVFVNLLHNAIKFTERGEIRVSVAKSSPVDGQPRLVASVQDTGIGIPANRIRDLFRTFSQLDVSTTRRFGGTGLGLAVSGRFVELMGGTFHVTSQPGFGSDFQFEIPLVPAGDRDRHDAPHHPKVGTDRSRNGENPEILVAEDNAVNQRLVFLMLEKLGFNKVDLAGNGREALEKIQSKHYDIALVDIQMPELDGLDVARSTVATLPAEDRPYMIALTANALVGDREQCLAAGMSDYLAKPIRRDKLDAALQKALAHHGTPSAA